MELEYQSAISNFLRNFLAFLDGSRSENDNSMVSFQLAIRKQSQLKKSFTEENILLAAALWSNYLSTYPSPAVTYSKKKLNIGYIADERTPFGSLFTALYCLHAGHNVIIQLQEGDDILTKELVHQVNLLLPESNQSLSVSENLKSGVDALIIDQGDKTYSTWKPYIKETPHLFNEKKNSLAVLTGNETEEQLNTLGNYIFNDFGNGMYNVRRLLVPANYNWQQFFPHLESKYGVINHNHYANSYEYNRSVFLLNRIAHWDNGFLLLVKSMPHNPGMGVLYFDEYKNDKHLHELINSQQNVEMIYHCDKLNLVHPFFPQWNEKSEHHDLRDFLTNLG